MEKIALHVEGMSCAHCETAVQKAVGELPGVKSVNASSLKNEVVVEFDTAAVTKEGIIEAIDDTGYRVV